MDDAEDGAAAADPWPSQMTGCGGAVDYPQQISDPLRRVQSTSAIPKSWTSASGSIPIRPTRRTVPDDISSLESSQSLILGGSFTEDSMGIKYFNYSSTAPGPTLPAVFEPQDALAAVEFSFGPSQHPQYHPHHTHSHAHAHAHHEETLAQSARTIPAAGGHWTWVPSDAHSHPHLATFNTNTSTTVAAAAAAAASAVPSMVPINTGGIPLPLPMSSSFTSNHHHHHGDFIDTFDVMEMADTLGHGSPTTKSHGGTAYSRYQQQQKLQQRRGGVGSCPLMPTLLEASLSAEDDGSDDTMHRAFPVSPSLDDLDALDRAASLATSGSRNGRTNNSNTACGIAIPGPRSAPLKLQRNARSASQPQFASSLPSSQASDRPMRSAARRSLAVTAAALRDTLDDSDSDASEGGMPVGSFGTGPVRRHNASSSVHHHHLHHYSNSHAAALAGVATAGAAGHASAGHGSATATATNTSPTHRHTAHHHTNGTTMTKKKHNPWTLEETLALVEGVRMAGVGKWAEIKRLPVAGVADILETRTPVDLKDKWRNLTRVARLPKAALRQRLQRGPSDVPLETMLMVKQLMEVGQDAE